MAVFPPPSGASDAVNAEEWFTSFGTNPRATDAEATLGPGSLFTPALTGPRAELVRAEARVAGRVEGRWDCSKGSDSIGGQLGTFRGKRLHARATDRASAATAITGAMFSFSPATETEGEGEATYHSTQAVVCSRRGSSDKGYAVRVVVVATVVTSDVSCACVCAPCLCSPSPGPGVWLWPWVVSLRSFLGQRWRGGDGGVQWAAARQARDWSRRGMVHPRRPRL